LKEDPVATGGKALLIFPKSFYSFAEGILKALSKTGYDVVVINDEYPINMIGKILGKLRVFWLLSAVTERIIYRKYVFNKRYDLVLIFKGRGMSSRLLKKIRQSSDRIVAFNFDSFTYNPSPLRWYRNVDKYCTFDYRDSKKYSIPLVELFSSLPVDNTPKRSLYNVSAILRNHSNRLKYLHAVLRILPKEKTYIYIFELNIFTFIFNFLRNPILYMKYWSNIHFKSLPYRDYVAVLKNSNFTVDYAHPHQSGITIRCFEALSAQTKIITNNGFVKHNAFFNDSNTVIFDGKTGREDARKHFESLRDSVPATHLRTVQDFLSDVLA
jgi:hypothetical protein